jgi:hypothetical protein
VPLDPANRQDLVARLAQAARDAKKVQEGMALESTLTAQRAAQDAAGGQTPAPAPGVQPSKR